MKFKEIKPGMVIHCKTEEETERLCEHLDSLGFTWSSGVKLTKTNYWEDNREETCYCINKNTIGYAKYSYYKNSEITEFSDLIIPELSSEEVLRIIAEICNKYSNRGRNCEEKCPFCYGTFCKDWMAEHTDVVYAICEQWKADHEKTEPEVETEWIWQGRIYRTEDNGTFWQVKDGTGFYDTGCESLESAEEYMADELKEYRKTHEGDYIAIVNRVCRAKR